MSSVLRVSLGINAVLLAVLAVLFLRGRSPEAPSVTSSPPQARGQSKELITTAAGRQVPAKSDQPGLTPAVMTQLERVGISREVLVSALREEFNRRWDKRLMELEKRYAPRRVPEREYVEFARLRQAEQLRELREALGEEGYRAWDKQQTLRLLNGGGIPMTEEEAEQAYRLRKEFEQQHRELEMAMEDGVADKADGAVLQTQAQEKLERELERLFGKQRLDQMRGVGDSVAEVNLRYGELNPTPTQANAVLQAENDYRAREAALAQRLKASPADAVNVAAELKALSDEREEDLRRIFGAEAYANAKRLNDPTYKALTQYAEAWGLANDEIQPVYESLASLHDEAERTRSAAAMREAAGELVNWREIDAAIEQARQQTEAGLGSLIGGERLHRLKQNGLLTHR